MGLIRLVAQATDLAVTLNIPRIPGEGGSAEEGIVWEDGKVKLNKAVEEGQRIMEEVWRTLTVKDWGLFEEN